MKNENVNVSQRNLRYHYISMLVKIRTKDQVADLTTKILPADTVKYFSKIVLGITVEYQSLNAYDTTYNIPFNDWGVVSVPDLIF